MPIEVVSATDSDQLVATLWGLRTRLRGHSHRAMRRVAVLRPKDVTQAAPDCEALPCRVIDSVYQGGA